MNFKNGLIWILQIPLLLLLAISVLGLLLIPFVEGIPGLPQNKMVMAIAQIFQIVIDILLIAGLEYFKD